MAREWAAYGGTAGRTSEAGLVTRKVPAVFSGSFLPRERTFEVLGAGAVHGAGVATGDTAGVDVAAGNAVAGPRPWS